MREINYRKFSSLVSTFPIAIVALMFAACGQTNPTPPAPPNVVRDEARVLDASARAALQEVQPDGTLVFSSAAGAPRSGQVKTQAINPSQLKPGDVIVSEPTSAAPYGLLRKSHGHGTSGHGQRNGRDHHTSQNR